MNKINTLNGLRQRSCPPCRLLFAAAVALPLTGFFVLRKAPELLPAAMLGLALLLTGLLAWAGLALERAATEAEAARLALTTRQEELEANSQGMTAANVLLAQASGRFQELFQGLPTACVCFDKDGRIMEWNRAFEQLYAAPLRLDDLIWDTIYAQAGPEIAAAVAGVFSGGRFEGMERTYRRPDGASIHLHCSIFPLTGAHGEITGAISAEIDITAQQEAEDALRQSEERLHTLYNVTSQPQISFEDKMQELLSVGAAQFGLALGMLARVQGTSCRSVQAVSPGDVVAAGTEFEACDLFCADTLKAIDTTGSQMQTYLGTPVRVGGDVWGTLCFAGCQPHPRLFTSGDRELLRLMAQWIGGEIARRQAEDAVLDSEERFRAAVASISEGLVVLDETGVITLWNDSAERILGLTRTEMYGLRPVNPEFAAVREDGTKFPEGSYPLMASLRRGAAQQDVVMGLPRQSEHLQGEMLWVSVSAKPLYQTGAAKPYAVVATFTDITERRRSADQITRQMVQITEYAAALEQQKEQLEEANSRLEMLALHDSLTGLGNRRAFESRLVQEVSQTRRYGTPLSLLLLDVDEFKGYNDSFGHPAGDEVLRLLASIIRSQGRETDFFARYGGEEFIVVLPLTDSAGALVLAERLRAAVETMDWPHRRVTASLGAATLLPGMPDGDALVSAADQALYAAKAAGRNCVFHALALDAPQPESVLCDSRLLAA